MKLTIQFSLDNDAYQTLDGYVDRDVCADSLDGVNRQLRNGHMSGPVFDPNGNTVGTWEIAE